MKAIKKFWKPISLVAVIALALALSGVRNIIEAQAQDDAIEAQAQDDARGAVIIPLGSTGLTFGEGIRTTLTNLGSRRIQTLIKVIDADGAVLKQEPMSLGQARCAASR